MAATDGRCKLDFSFSFHVLSLYLQFSAFQTSGAIMISAGVHAFLGAFGIIGFLMKSIGPITIATSIVLSGIDYLSLTAEGLEFHRILYLQPSHPSFEQT